MNLFILMVIRQAAIVAIAFAVTPSHSRAPLPEVTNFIVIDQFGYLPISKKTAVIKNPKVGFDSSDFFQPGQTYTVINAETSKAVFTGAPQQWKNGETDKSSGDATWWFDFSKVESDGKYYILDIEHNLRSQPFEIRSDIYSDVMKQAIRTFFYQRSGFAKMAPFAGVEWADAASHLQDVNARDFMKKHDASTEIDVSGGWYDAGDYNKYTNWTANYIVGFMTAFRQNPGVWGDDYQIPESGNQIPDILDEAKWGVDHLLRLQRPNGSVLSVVGASHASPPSAAKGPTFYGPPSTSATLNAAAAFAVASKVYSSVGLKEYSESLKKAAVKAWDWAEQNPSVLFNNNLGSTLGLAAGNQETDDYGRLSAKVRAAVFLYDLTAEHKYRLFFDSSYRLLKLMKWTFAYPFDLASQETLLHYISLPNASPSVREDILQTYKKAMDGADNFQAIHLAKDPYRAHIKEYTWGSNAVKASTGLMYLDYIWYQLDDNNLAFARHAAADYLHYLHGVNPLNIVYLSNMAKFGGENSVNEFYHAWFSDGSSKWDRVGESTFGPPPGFLTGGPNPKYDWSECCPSNCGSAVANAKCLRESIVPPKNQPDQKSYKDFNTPWPLKSWQVTENSCGSQLVYIRLLAAFLPKSYDCSGTKGGSASYDVCGVCAGGGTGINPILKSEACVSNLAAKGSKPESPRARQ